MRISNRLDKFFEAVKKMIEHNTSHRVLDGIFSEYRYWINCKVKMSCKLERFTQFHASELDVEWISGKGLGKYLIHFQIW